MNKPIFIIEHLEPELWPWCIIEYEHISRLIGKENLWFTNVPKDETRKLDAYGKVFNKSVKGMALENSCVLDPNAKELLSPSNSKKFDYFIFGGILGDNPPRKRTKEELTIFLNEIPAFNIGQEQMSTDNAVFAVNKIISKGKDFSKLKFQNGIEIRKNKVESFILPYRYNLVNGKPLISARLIKFLKRKKGF